MDSYFTKPRHYRLPALLNEENSHYINNNSQFLIYSDIDEFEADHKQFLTKVLSSVNLDYINVDHLYIKNNKTIKFPYEVIEKRVNKVICFGLDSERIGLMKGLQKYKIYTFDSFQLLLADSLIDLQSSLQKKKRLWNCLKRLFEYE